MHLWHIFPTTIIPMIFLFLLARSSSSVDGARLRTIGEPCADDELMKCAEGFECAHKGTRGKRRCRQTASTTTIAAVEAINPSLSLPGEEEIQRSSSSQCLRAKCPVLFPDCPSDSVPVLSTGPVSNNGEDPDQCCPPSLVQCKCDPQKCLVPACPQETERILRKKGSIDTPGQCCDHFECRIPELNCQNIHCPDPTAAFLDLYSSDGHNCPEDSYRPDPYIPTGSCCPIVPQCQCRLGICDPARCSPGQKLVIERRGQGKPGKCCDKYKCSEGDGKNNGSELKGGGCQYQGRTFMEGQIWHSVPCQECQCSGAGVALCRRMECPALAHDCQWVGLSPGECCPVCLGCRDEQGKNYAVGQHWERDGCTNCTCGHDFRWQCQKFICQTNCENPRPVPGECCPVCDRQSIIVLEPAPTCPKLADCPLRCEFGLQQDQWTGCFECQCANGTVPNGTMTAAGNGQEQQCEPLNVQNCPRFCAHGYLREEHTNCLRCRCAHCPPMFNCDKNCVHGFETNWMGCPICKCRADDNQLEMLQRVTVSSPPMEFPSSQQHCIATGTSSSFSITESTTSKYMGEWWTENCRQCFCQQGKAFCSLLACPARPADCPEENWFRHEDDCCPRCGNILPLQNPTMGEEDSSNSTIQLSQIPPPGAGQQVCHSPGTGQLFVDGQTWHLAEDGCLGCTCRMGHVLCVWNDGLQCPSTPCENPLIQPNVDKCCPRCQSLEQQKSLQPETTSSLLISNQESLTVCQDNTTGTMYRALATWRRDECQSCQCTAQGQIQCFRERCPINCPNGRLLSLKGRCCPICSDSLATSPTNCIYDGRAYAPGEHFQDGPCRNCTCLQGGLLKCLEIHCPICSTGSEPPAILNNQCCAKCVEPAEDLLYSSFERGQEQTIFLQSDKTTNIDGNEKELPFWLLLCLGLPVLAFLLFAIGIGCLVIKCRKQKAKWINADEPDKPPIRWNMSLPDHHRTTERRKYPKKGTLEKDFTANASLLRLKDEKLGDND